MLAVWYSSGVEKGEKEWSMHLKIATFPRFYHDSDAKGPGVIKNNSGDGAGSSTMVS